MDRWEDKMPKRVYKEQAKSKETSREAQIAQEEEWRAEQNAADARAHEVNEEVRGVAEEADHLLARIERELGDLALSGV